VQVVTERDEDRGVLRAVATGHVALAAVIPPTLTSESDARELAAQSAHLASSALSLIADTGGFWVYQSARGRGLGFFQPPRTLVVDQRGSVRLNVSGALTFVGTPAQVLTELREKIASAPRLLGLTPSVRLLVGARLLDLTADVNTAGMLGVAEAALARAEGEAQVVVIIER
jgi:hypothetical protein